MLVRFEIVTNDDSNPDIRLHTDRLALENILEKTVPRLAALCGTRILAVVADALATWRAVQHPGLVPPVDYSFVWRPAVEDLGEEKHRGDLQDALIDALRDGGAAIIDGDPSKIREVVTFFAERPWTSNDALVFISSLRVPMPFWQANWWRERIFSTVMIAGMR